MSVRSSFMRQAAIGVLLCTTLLLLPQAWAHRGHAVWTDITWNGESFEIVHRMHLADAVTVNRFLGGRKAIESLESLARLALYVDERFTIQGANNSANKIETLGAEIEDDFLFVYQEWAVPLPKVFPAIDNSVLLDVEPDAQAFVRISGPGLNEERDR